MLSNSTTQVYSRKHISPVFQKKAVSSFGNAFLQILQETNIVGVITLLDGILLFNLSKSMDADIPYLWINTSRKVFNLLNNLCRLNLIFIQVEYQLIFRIFYQMVYAWNFFTK